MTRDDIKEARRVMRLTQSGLGQHLGLCQGTISRWEQKDGTAPLWLPYALNGLYAHFLAGHAGMDQVPQPTTFKLGE